MVASPKLVAFIERDYLRGFLDAQLLPAVLGTSSTKESDRLALLFLQHTTKTMYAICALNNLDFGQESIVLARTIFEYSIRLAYIYHGSTDSEIRARARSFVGRAYEDQLQKQDQVDDLKRNGKCLNLIRDIESTGPAPTSSTLQKDWDDFPNEKRMATELGEPFECDWYFLYWSMSKIAHPTATNLLNPDVDGDTERALLLGFNYHYRIAEIVCSALGDAGSALKKELDKRATKFLTLANSTTANLTMDRPAKILVCGAVCAILAVIGGIANSYRLESKLQGLEAACAEQTKGRGTNSPHFVPACDSHDLMELGGLQGVQAEIVVAQRQVSNSKDWPYVIAAAVLLLSALPWLWYFLLRRIRELREAVLGK